MTKQIKLIFTLVFALLMLGLTGVGVTHAAPEAQTAPPLTLETLKNSEYRTQATITRTVQLRDGVYEELATGLRIELSEFYALGDLNNDGADDGAAVLITTRGQQTPFFELVAVTSSGEQTEIGGLILLGEGIKVNQLTIENGEIAIEYLRPQLGDEACCPSRLVTERFSSRLGLLAPKQTKSFGQLFPYQQGQLYGYLNALGEIVIEPQFALAGEFAEGMAAVSYDGKTTGFINQIGELVIEPRFSYAGQFSDGLAIVALPGVDADAPFLSAYIDRTGHFVFGDQRFYSAEPFSEGLAAVSLDGERYGYIDLLGDTVIEPQFAYAESFSEGLAPVQVGDLVGYIDRTGAFVFDLQFQAADPFQNGLAKVVIGEKTGYINHSGQMVIEPLFDYGSDFSAGRAIVAQEEKLFYIDAAGNIEIDIPDLTQAGDFVEGLAAVGVGDQYGYVDLQGNFVVSPQFTYASNFENGLAIVQTSTTWGLLNSIGELVLEIDRFAAPAAQKAALFTAEAMTATQTISATTELIEYVPTLPNEVRSGACSLNSELLGLASAWQCKADGDTFDPCLVGDDSETLVCVPSPAEQYPGFRLVLEKPLPAVNITAAPPSDLWQLRTDDGALCVVNRMRDMQVAGNLVTHICSDGTALLGEIDRSGALWTAEKGALVNQTDGTFAIENSMRVGIITAWQPVESES